MSRRVTKIWTPPAQILPAEDREYAIVSGTESQIDYGSKDLLWDWLEWWKWSYKSVRFVKGPQGRTIRGVVSEAKGFTVSADSGHEFGGQVALPGLKIANLSGRLTRALGVSFGTQEALSLNYECEVRRPFRPIAVITYDVTEFAGYYMDWHWTRGTPYLFRVRHRRILGYECEDEEAGDGADLLGD